MTADMSTCEEQILVSLGSPVIDCHSSRHIVGNRGAIQLSLIPLEPVIFLQGDGRLGRHSENKPAVTRGYLHLKVNQQAKIKSICVSFHGLARFQPLGGMSLFALGTKTTLPSVSHIANA